MFPPDTFVKVLKKYRNEPADFSSLQKKYQSRECSDKIGNKDLVMTFLVHNQTTPSFVWVLEYEYQFFQIVIFTLFNRLKFEYYYSEIVVLNFKSPIYKHVSWQMYLFVRDLKKINFVSLIQRSTYLLS